jgi:hypothetical protein
MSDPCKQEGPVDDLWEKVGAQDRIIVRVETSVEQLVAEFREVAKDLRASLLDSREQRIRQEQQDKAINTLFSMVRDEKDSRSTESQAFRTWKDNMEGRISTLKAIPIICVILTTLIALGNYFNK